MGDSPRHKDEAARAQPDLAVPKKERRLPAGEIERLIGGRMDMRGRRGLASRQSADEFNEIGPLCLRWAESGESRIIRRADNEATVDCLHRSVDTSAASPGSHAYR